ncbi:MAG: hypothetical protein M1826_003660 [Phylliscum demangeonii]|nr:MAG: hypothetical protein M1826_003660 [Phylliscum demangeonii]
MGRDGSPADSVTSRPLSRDDSPTPAAASKFGARPAARDESPADGAPQRYRPGMFAKKRVG